MEKSLYLIVQRELCLGLLLDAKMGRVIVWDVEHEARRKQRIVTERDHGHTYSPTRSMTFLRHHDTEMMARGHFSPGLFVTFTSKLFKAACAPRPSAFALRLPSMPGIECA